VKLKKIGDIGAVSLKVVEISSTFIEFAEL
jgi:hypothetical protein